MRRIFGLTVLLAGVLLWGCGSSEPAPTDVSGTATFDGKPIVYGQLELIPDRDKEMRGPAGEAEIIDGKFDSKLGGRGMYLGDYQVRVTAWAERPPTGHNDETKVSNAPPPIFLGYSIAINLAAENNVIAIPAAAKGFNASKANAARPANAP